MASFEPTHLPLLKFEGILRAVQLGWAQKHVFDSARAAGATVAALLGNTWPFMCALAETLVLLQMFNYVSFIMPSCSTHPQIGCLTWFPDAFLLLFNQTLFESLEVIGAVSY